MVAKAKKAADELKKSKKLNKITETQEQELPVANVWRGGSKSLYEERFDKIAYELAAKGLTTINIAGRLGVADRTIRHWMGVHPSFREAIDAGRAIAVGNVENALYRSATGFTYEEEAINKNGEVVTLRKYEKPNITAQIFYLCNRAKEAWQNVNRVEHTARDGKPLTVYFDIPRPEGHQQVIEVKTEEPEGQVALPQGEQGEQE